MTPPPAAPRTIRLDTVLRAVTVVTASIAVLVTRADPDLWGHVRFGLDLLRSHALSASDPYSFTSDRPWVNHEWLSELLFGVAYSLGGGTGLVLIKALLVGVAILAIVDVAAGEGAKSRELVIVGALALAALLPRASQVRPQLFSVCFFALLLNLLVRAERGARRALFAVPVLLACWTNAHGAWPIGCATVVLWTAGTMWMPVRGPRSEVRGPNAREPAALVLLPIATVLATLVNPYGVGLWRFLAETVGPARAYLVEWAPITTVPALFLLWLLFWGILLVALRRAGLPANPAHLMIPVALGIASARVSRIDVFFALSVVAFFARRAVRRAGDRADPVNVPVAARSVFREPAALLLFVPLLGLPLATGRLLCIDVHGPWMPEPETPRVIADLRGRMVTYFDWGEYALWYLPPGLRISMDGRRETVYSPATIEGHLELYRGTDAGLAYLRRLSPDYVWLPNESPALRRLRDDGWSPIFTGPASTILSPTSSSDRTMRAAGDRPCRCFPGP